MTRRPQRIRAELQDLDRQEASGIRLIVLGVGLAVLSGIAAIVDVFGHSFQVDALPSTAVNAADSVSFDVRWEDDGEAARYDASTDTFVYAPGVTCEDVLRLQMRFEQDKFDLYMSENP